ncbi:MAG: transposase [Agathobacter sp.]
MCPAGNQPKSSSIVKSTGKVRASFPKNKCENCPYKDQCRPKTSNKTSAVYISKGSHERAKAQRFTGTWQFKFLSKVRNGVETIPSTLRRKYNIDTMPVRGRIRMKHLFGFKIGALNFRKLLKYLGSLEKCALNPEIA